MSNFEFTRIINGEEVKAVTTYASSSQLYIKLLSDDFKGVVGHSLSFMSRVYNAFMDNSGNFTDTGNKSINHYIESLHKAYKLFLQHKVETNDAIDIISKMLDDFNFPIDNRLEAIYNQRKEQKIAFKSRNIDLANYRSQLKIFSTEIDELKEKKAIFFNETTKEYIQNIYGLTIQKGACCDDVYCAIIRHFSSIIYQKTIHRFY